MNILYKSMIMAILIVSLSSVRLKNLSSRYPLEFINLFLSILPFICRVSSLIDLIDVKTELKLVS